MSREFVYRWRKISEPEVVGMRARTMQVTSGRGGREVCFSGAEGGAGVLEGVKAGEMREGTAGVPGAVEAECVEELRERCGGKWEEGSCGRGEMMEGMVGGCWEGVVGGEEDIGEVDIEGGGLGGCGARGKVDWLSGISSDW